MRRAPGSSRPGPPLGGFFVIGLTVAVIVGTAWGYHRWQEEVAVATAGVAPTASSVPSGTPQSVPSGDSTGEPDLGSALVPTFEVLEPTDGRSQPVVLLVGDGYAAGRGASSDDTAYPALLARDLGWDVRLATRVGAGYVSDSPTLLDLFESSPASWDPDLIIVQGAYGSNASNAAAKSAVEALAAAIESRYPGVPRVVVTPFGATQEAPQTDTRERTIARTWREDADVLVLRPRLDGWSDFGTASGAPDDAGHQLIATSMVQAFREAGLAPPV